MRTLQPIHVLLLSLGIFAGILMTAQFNSPQTEVVDPYEPLKELQQSIDILSGDQVHLQESIADARKEIEHLESITAQGEKKNTLSNLKKEIGLTEVTGKGVRITLDDQAIDRPIFSDAPQSVCYAADLRDIINVLRVAGASAIAINGQRIIDTTSVICVGQSVLVNNVRMLPPFTILAISPAGPSQLATYLETGKFLPDLHRRAENKEVVFTIDAGDDITIPLYKGNLETKFAHL